MATVEFPYDPDDPLHVTTWVVPADVHELVVYAAGGGTWWGTADDTGEATPPWRGVAAYGLPVTPGDELHVLLGGASTATEPGSNGGGPGGGGIAYTDPEGGPPVNWRGFGGGGATEVTRNGSPWIVAGGAGGAVENSVAQGSLDPVVTPTGSPPPGPAADPRVPLAVTPLAYPYDIVVDVLPGATGDVHDGAAGVLAGSSAGSGGGGGGWGGGASGGLLVYQAHPPWDVPGRAPNPGRFGGFLIPADATTDPVWDPSTSAIYPRMTARGHGFVRIDYEPGTRGGWSVRRRGF